MDNSLINATLLGILEGLTEFIPVSSTGHLIILSDLLDFKGHSADTFSIFIQLGAILAVVWLYRDRFKSLIDLRNYSKTSIRFETLKIIIACIPVCLCGLFFHSIIKELLFAPQPVAVALIVGGVALILVEFRKSFELTSTIEQISFRQALAVGIFQCFALWPGMSRSGSCIVGGRLFGLSSILAAEFSFIVAVPVMCAAVFYDLYKSLDLLTIDSISIFSVGFVVAGVTAVFAIKFFLRLLERLSLIPFGIYRILLGLVILIWL